MHSFMARLQSTLDRAAATFSAKSPDLIMALLILGVFLLLALAVPRLLRRTLGKANVPKEAVRITERIAFFSLLFLGIFAALNELDVSLGALGIEVSLLGVGIGFALKDLLTNAASGLMI